MRPSSRLVCSDRPEGRVLSCLYPPATQPFPQFMFEGRAYQYKVLPFGLSRLPHVFTKVMEVALVPLRERGMRVLNDWLILAKSHEQLCAHRDLVLRHLSQLGLGQLGKEQSFLGMELDSVNQIARLTQDRAQSVLNCLKTLSGRTAVPLKLFQKLLGHMASATAIVPLGLLHMSAPLQLWLHGQVPRWARKRGTHQVQNTPACRTTFSPWTELSFLRAGVPQEQVSRHSVVFTDASATSWGAMYNGHAVSGVWTGPKLRRHINCLELLAVRIALRRLRGQGRYGPYRQCDDRCVCQLARWFTLPSQLARLPTAEREGCLQAEDGPVYSGCHHLGLRSTRCALPAQVACSLY